MPAAIIRRAVEEPPKEISMMINIDHSNTFRGFSKTAQEEIGNTKRSDDDDSLSAGEEDGHGGELEQFTPRPLGHGKNAQESAESIYRRSLSSCNWIQSDKMKKIPKFDAKELHMGLVLGSGSFGAVYEIRGFHLKDIAGSSGRSSATRPTTNRTNGTLGKRRGSSLLPEDEEVIPGEIESRNFIAKHCYRNNGDARYAIKKLRTGIVDDESDFMNGMADLANETLYLASLRKHPNIIKLRGIAKENMFSQDYFLILDRLYDTLQVRILKWKKKKNKSKGFVRSYLKDRNGEKKRKLFEERMQYAMDLVAAISYIHEHRIIHRDLKPDNIGFDVRNDIKVFDFGLAREMPPAKANSPDEAFHLSTAGSPRYMAPEVGLGQKQNQACDIYSFGLIFWEMMTLKRPFPNVKSMDQLKEMVWAPWGPQQRPPIPAKMTESIKVILHQAWNHNYKARPKAPILLTKLKEECLKLRNDMRISHTARRSTFVLTERRSRSMELRNSRSKEVEKSPPRAHIAHNDSTARLSVHSATQFDTERFHEDGTESSW